MQGARQLTMRRVAAFSAKWVYERASHLGNLYIVISEFMAGKVWMRKWPALIICAALTAAGCARAPAEPQAAGQGGALPGQVATQPGPGGAQGASEGQLERWSPVTATVALLDDPGVRSGFLPAIAPRPLTLVIRFTGPVDRVTTQEAILQNLKGAPDPTDPAAPRIEWQDETEARLRIPDVDARPGAYVEISLDGARDRDGLPIKSAGLRMALVKGRAAVWRVPVGGNGSAAKVMDVYEPLTPLAARPDGSRIYLARPAYHGGNSPLGIPYMYDTASGRLIAGADAVDLSGQVVLDPASNDIFFHGTSLFSRFTPDGRVLHDQKGVFNSLRGGGPILAPRVSGDGQRLSALLLQSEADDSADLLIYDIGKRKLATYFDIARPHDNGAGGRHFGLEWSPDGRHLLFDTKAGTGDAVECYVLDVVSDQKVRIGSGCRVGSWSPTGDRVWLAGTGVVTADGKAVLQATDGTERAFWSPDGARLLIGDTVWEIATGRKTRLSLPAEAMGKAYPLGWAADGRSVFIGFTEREGD